MKGACRGFRGAFRALRRSFEAAFRVLMVKGVKSKGKRTFHIRKYQVSQGSGLLRRQSRGKMHNPHAKVPSVTGIGTIQSRLPKSRSGVSGFKGFQSYQILEKQ